MPTPNRARAVFDQALELPSSTERAAFLDRACPGEPALRARVEGLLRAYAEAGSFLELSPAGSTDAPPTDSLAAGTAIGPYRLIEVIGEGGMGSVWLAEQQQPVRRRVAVKIIKSGMDSEQGLAWFEIERQVLALMDHPNIARVLDAGAMADGRPFLVMELVRGVPITAYCDDHKLTPRERLGLFADVCRAVQHAHQKGVIHRDLKPSNVLVAPYDGEPVVKVIDFGVAKAFGAPLTEKTLVTGFGDLVGTPEYMSPEQAELNNRDIDTRSDIYSLGVILYELLTGTPPLPKKRVQDAALLEVLRLVREEEPPRPSARLSTLGAAAETVCANRQTEPRRLMAIVKGELDWIVMKAVEKDRSRRYESASALAQDVERYLHDEPVMACPPSPAYRLRMLARRHKGGLAVAGLVLFFLVLLGSGAGWAVRDRSAREADAARQRGGRQAKAAGQIESILAETDRLATEQKWPEALASARRAAAVVAGGEADPATANRVRDRLHGLEFVNRLEQIRVDRAAANWAQVSRDYSQAFLDHGVNVEEWPAEESIERLRARPELAIPIATALDQWVAICDPRSDNWKRAAAVARGIDPDPFRDRLRSMWGKPHTQDVNAELRRLADSIEVRAQPPATLVALAQALMRAESPSIAARILRDGRAFYPSDFWINYELGITLYSLKDHVGAVRFFSVAVAIRPTSPIAHNSLGTALRDQKKVDDALASFQKAVEFDPNNPYYRINLGYALGLCGKPDEGLAEYKEVLRLHPGSAYAHHAFGCFVRDIQHDSDGAITWFKKAIRLDPKYAPAHGDIGYSANQRGNLEEAVAAYREAHRLSPAFQDQLTRVLNKLAVALTTHADSTRQDPDRAISLAREAFNLAPDELRCRFGLGYVLGLNGKLNEAVALYEEAICLHPGSPYAHHAFGCFVRDIQHDSDEAVTWFKKAIRLDPKYAPAHGEIGYTANRRGKLEEAVAAYRIAYRLSPDYGEKLAICLNKLAWHLATHADPTRRDPARAVSLAREAVELRPRSANFTNTLGVALYRAGHWKDAIGALQSADELSGGKDFGVNALFIAMSYCRLGDKDRARPWYDRAVKWADQKGAPDEELRRFRAEAAELLELNQK